MENRQNRRDFVKLTAAAGIPLALGAFPRPAAGVGKEAGSDGELQENQPTLFETIRSRRSVRQFQPTPVPEDHLRQILDAARLSPTSGNQQPWKFLVVQDREVMNELEYACVEGSLAARRARGMPATEEVAEAIRTSLQGYFSAPVFVVVLTDGESRYPTYNHWDGPLAAGYLMLAARALGYGTVFVTDSIPAQVTKEVLNIPDRYTRVCITPLGVPEAWPESPQKKELEEFIVYEKF